MAFVSVVAGTFAFSVALAQRPFAHHLQDGFAQVLSIAQDSAGFLWVSSQRFGRFDGYQLKEYMGSKGEHIEGRIKVSPRGDVWVHGDLEMQLFEYDRKQDAFHRHALSVDGAVSAMAFENDGRLWLGILDKGLMCYDPLKGEIEKHVSIRASDSDVGSNRILDIVNQENNMLLVATASGLWLYDKLRNKFSRPQADLSNGILLTSVRKIFPGKDHYWFFKPDRLVQTDRNFTILRDFKFPPELKAGNFLSSVDRDRKGVFWIGSYGTGLWSMDPATERFMQFKHNKDNPHSIASDILQTVLVDREQNVWVGTYDQGFDQLKFVSVVFYNAILPGKATPGVPIVLQSGKNRYLLQESKTEGLWLASLDSGLHSISFRRIRTEYDLNGTHLINSFLGQSYWWIGTWDRGLLGAPLDPQTGLPGTGKMRRITHEPGNPFSVSGPDVGVWLEEQGNLWVTSPQHTLFKIDLDEPYGSERAIVRYNHSPGNSNSLSEGPVFGIRRISEDAYWVLTGHALDKLTSSGFEHIYRKPGATLGFDCLQVGKGGTLFLGAFDGLTIGEMANGRYAFKEVEALRNRGIYSIEEDRLGRLWLGTEAGLVLFDRTSNKVYQFKMSDGLMGNEFNTNSSTQTSDGLMIFGGYAQTIFDPAEFHPSSGQLVPQLTALEVNNQPVVIGQHDSTRFSIPEGIETLTVLELDYLHNVLTLEFSSNELSAPEKSRYRYILDGFDPNWNEVDAGTRRVTYTNLDPGNYVFRLRASNRDQVWSLLERQLSIVILPPPWRTWWAYTGYSLLVAALLVGARRSIVQRERLKASLQLEKVEREKEHFELEKAKEVDRVKTSFFTNISHEFRTPLTLIKGPVDTMLERYKDDPEAVSRLKLVQRNSDLLLKLINQLLDLAKLESGTLKVEKTDAEAYSFVRGVAGSFESMAKQKGISLVIDVPSGQQAARFDKDKVETVLINLINNAIKFTPTRGTVRVSASVEEGVTTAKAQGRKVLLRLSVSDTGIGIPADHQSKIFERFHQVSEAHKEVGTGIGLALVKELVTLMGGEISVKSEAGKGSVFGVHLPMEVAEASEPVQVTQGENGQQPTANSQQLTEEILNIEYRILNDEVDPDKPQVLVVEDNADLRAFIIDSLGSEFQFHQAENGKQGLQVATEHIPDMIISDVMMPEMDGMEMTARLKGDIKTSHIPLILLTAKSGEDSKLEGLSKGADDYLTKPFNKQELLLKVRNGTQRMQKIREKMKVELLSSQKAVKVLSQDEQFLNKVKETILERMSDEQLSVESLADDIGMSRVQLYRKVTALTGMSVNELIRKLRLQRAAQLLSQNWGPVSQVAYEVGFSNLSYFSKVFKEEFGISPSEYVH
jgi:signal transduction histidine kinase/DNA-binding response OmpR family regulator/ligand-binding sensor domain-containing protein